MNVAIGNKKEKVLKNRPISFAFASEVLQVKRLLKISGTIQVEDCDYTTQPLGGNICN